MRWLEDIPFELRLQIYEELCVATPVLVHNVGYPQDCEYLNDKNHRIASSISLLLSCSQVRAEFEAIFWHHTTFTAHLLENGSCFKYCLPRGDDKETLVQFFKQRERRKLHDFVLSRNIQVQLTNRDYVHRLGSQTPSFMKHTFDRFVISEPLGCHRHPPRRANQARELVRLLSFCCGRVREVEFWWHPVRWQPAEAAIPWHITMDMHLNFTIRGPTRKGFVSLKKRFSKAIWEYWPCRTWNQRSAGSKRRAECPRPQFTFVKDHENTMPDHTKFCNIKKQKQYKMICNCGDPGHYGGTFDLCGTEGT